MLNPFDGVTTGGNEDIVGEGVSQNEDEYELKMEHMEHMDANDDNDDNADNIPLQYDIIRGDYYYTITGSNCVVTSVINGEKCNIIDLTINEEYTVNQKGLTRIKNDIELQTAKLQYEQYINQHFESTESAESDSSDSNKPINPNDIEIGGYYTEGRINCVVIDINHKEDKVIIIDLFENKQRKTKINRLYELTDTTELNEAQLKYHQYLNEKHQENIIDNTSSNKAIIEFILTTSITKDPDEYKVKIKRNNIGCDPCVCIAVSVCCIIICVTPLLWGVYLLLSPIIISTVTVFLFLSNFIDNYPTLSMVIGIIMIILSLLSIIIASICICGGIRNIGKHHNKLVFNDEEKQIYWYKNEGLYDKMSYTKFVRIAYNGCKNSNQWMNVYIVRNDDNKPLRFNGYVTDKQNAIKFTETVNQFWAKKQNIKNIDNML